MSYLYLFLNLGSISIPFLYSFHPKLKFYKLWKSLAISTAIGMLVFIPWDVIFTSESIWGFNPKYLLGLHILNLPVEEWLFFICIPYACVFTHYALLYYFPKLNIPKKQTQIVSWLLVSLFIVLAIYNHNKAYTFVNFSLASLVTILVIRKNIELLQSYLLTFIVMLIPFFLVNGTLTGSFIENEVVWYNNTENLGFRLFTIPIEDIIYAFSLILLNLFIVSMLNKRHSTT